VRWTWREKERDDEFRVKYVLKATIAISLCVEGMLKECEFVGFGKEVSTWVRSFT
jgi:hypothetical protein